MDPNSRAVAMGAAGSGSSAVNFAAILDGSTFSIFNPVSAVDSDNNFYIAFTNSQTPRRAYLAKYSSLATLVWQREITDPGGRGVIPYDITIDSNKDIIIATGLYNQYAFLYTSQLIKLNSSGTLLWSNGFTFGGSNRDYSFYGVTVDSSNNIYAVIAESNTRALCTFNSSGVLQSQHSITSPSGHVFRPYKIKCYGSNLYLYGQGVISSLGGLAIARFTTSGSFGSAISSETSGSNLYAPPGNLTVDSSGNVYVIAQVSGGYPYLFKYTSGLSLSWKIALITYASNNSSLGIAVNGTGNNVYVSSDGPSSTSRVIQNINSSGSLVWSRAISGSSVSSTAGTVSVANTGDVMVTQSPYNSSISRYNIVSYLIPPDGSKTGTYLGTTYSSPSYGTSGAGTSDYSLNLALTTSSFSVLSFPINVSASSLTSSIATLS